MSVEINLLGDGGGQFLNGRGDGVDVFGLIEKENDKFVAAKTHYGIGRPYAIDHSVRNSLQKLVAGVMAQAVVDDFEIVEIDEDHRRPTVVSLRVQQGLRKAVLEQGAIREPSKSIVIRHELNAVFGPLSLDRNAGDASRDINKSYLDLGWLTLLCGIDHECPERRALMRLDRGRPP